MSEPQTKRRRVTAACQSCRSLKSKCDGRKPICGRCEGYGYVCHWPPARRQPWERHPVIESISAYQNRAQELRVNLSEEDALAVEEALATLHRLLPTTGSTEKTETPPAGNQNISSSPIVASHRFLGTASDVQFFNQAKHALEPGAILGDHDEELESYEQEILWERDGRDRVIPKLPDKSCADQYIETYFATIHIAYPFVCKPLFLERYQRLWTDGLLDDDPSSWWLSLLYSIFAIGAYYNSFPGLRNDDSRSHTAYYGQALKLGLQDSRQRSPGCICALLAQCFYLLATSQTDTCWLVLGKAIRIGQSIGLHVERLHAPNETSSSVLKQEMRRRAWYSIYVLDRLLALQLGRPFAVHLHSHNVELPSPCDDSFFDLEQDSLPTLFEENAITLGEYFLAVIEFSHIIGQVIEQIYSPRLMVAPQQQIQTTVSLDGRLLDWKAKLPRRLRFDLGHTFEKNPLLRRQRNMLAIKFHHLRALLHRPYFDLNRLKRYEPPAIQPDNHESQMSHLRATCISEAHATANMLYNVPDEKSLVHDFPWWQMISCLLCASSILLVAKAYADGIASDSLNDDAETCLKAFDALSTNSDAARFARDMMKNLQQKASRSAFAIPARPISIMTPGNAVDEPIHAAQSLHKNWMTGQIDQNSATSAYTNALACFAGVHEGSSPGDLGSWPAWPGEMTDPLMWSAQYMSPLAGGQFKDSTNPGRSL